MNKNLQRLTEPGGRLYLIFLVLFAAAALFFKLYELAVAEGVIILILMIYSFFSRRRRAKQLESYIESVTYDTENAKNNTLMNFPLPIAAFRLDDSRIIWGNEMFFAMNGSSGTRLDARVSDLVPEFNGKWLLEGKTQYPSLLTVNGRKYQIHGNIIRSEDGDDSAFMGITYWVDMTEYDDIRMEYENSRPVACVLVIDKAASKVYAVHYGAGYDREIDISSGAGSTYSVTQALTGCSSSFSGTSVSENAAFSAEYTVQSGYENLTVTVSMGGTDITSSAVTGNSVSVPSVTGDIVVTAAASEILNLVPSSTDSEGGIYNGTGYKDGYRLNSSGAEAALSGFAVTGFIPFTKGQTIRVGGSGITFSEYGSMLYFYDGSKTAVAQTGIDYNQIGKSEYGVWVTDEANSVVCLTPSANYPSSGSESGYFRVSAKGSGAKLVVTLDKEIE